MALMPLLKLIKIMKREIFIIVVDKNLGFNQQCLILYHGDKVALGVKGGRIDSNLEIANVYFDWGFIRETLNDCLLKICTELQSNSPNVTNVNYTIKDPYWKGNVITNAKAILEYNLTE